MTFRKPEIICSDLFLYLTKFKLKMQAFYLQWQRKKIKIKKMFVGLQKLERWLLVILKNYQQVSSCFKNESPEVGKETISWTWKLYKNNIRVKAKNLKFDKEIKGKGKFPQTHYFILYKLWLEF